LKNFGAIVEKGSIELNEILDSEVFHFNFDYDGWISNHTNDESYTRAYNKSIFDLRQSYREVFPEEDLFGPIDDDKKSISMSTYYQASVTISQFITRLDQLTTMSKKLTFYLNVVI
jgi:hypothetical protein